MICMEELFIEGKAKLVAVVQRKDPKSGAWHEEGQVGDLTPENFERLARKYLKSYRQSRPQLPKESSRVIRRTVATFDEPMGW